MQDNLNLVMLVIGAIVVFVVVVVVLILRNSKLNDEAESLEGRLFGAEDEVRRLREQVMALEKAKSDLTGWLETANHHRKTAEEDLQSRPRVERKIYRILTVGMKATGKSSLTLKWANPLVKLETIEGTKMERYERLVSLSEGKDVLTQHIFEVYDWGGEHIVDAQEQLVTGEINGILMVVDLGGRDARQVEPQRIEEQLVEFNRSTLQYFLTPTIVMSCKTIVLFINKSDLISNSPAQAEALAREYYAPLIENLQRHASNIDVKVMIGSATFGHSTHVLFSHFVEQILPESAYDKRLLQRIKGTVEPRRRTQTQTGLSPFNGSAAHHQEPLTPAPSRPAAQAPPPPPNARVLPPAPPRNLITAKLPPPNGGHHDSTHLLDATMPYPNQKNAPLRKA